MTTFDPHHPKVGDRFTFDDDAPRTVTAVEVHYTYDDDDGSGYMHLDRFVINAKPLPVKLITEDTELRVTPNGHIHAATPVPGLDRGSITLHTDGTYTEHPA